MKLTVRHSSAPEFKAGDKVHLHKKGTPGIVVEHVRRHRPERITLLEADIRFVNTNRDETTLEIAGWVSVPCNGVSVTTETYTSRFLILQ